MREIIFKQQGISQKKEGALDLNKSAVILNGIEYKIDELSFDNPVDGMVYGTLLNYKDSYKAFEQKMVENPYKEPPKAPILYIKPINTFLSSESVILLPSDVTEVKIGAALGIVFGKTTTKVKEEEALDYVLGYTIVNDVQIPHASVYRPAIKEIARDGFCPMGPWIVKKEFVPNPDHLAIQVTINGKIRQESSTENLIRPIRKLISDVTEFMTLHSGDVLHIGVPGNAPLAKAEDSILIEIEGIGVLKNTVKKERSLAGEWV